MTTIQLGFPAPWPTSPRRSGPKRASTVSSLAPNKPNRRRRPERSAAQSNGSRLRLGPISTLKSQISNARPCPPTLSSPAPNKPNLGFSNITLSSSMKGPYPKINLWIGRENKPNQTQSPHRQIRPTGGPRLAPCPIPPGAVPSIRARRRPRWLTQPRQRDSRGTTDMTTRPPNPAPDHLHRHFRDARRAVFRRETWLREEPSRRGHERHCRSRSLDRYARRRICLSQRARQEDECPGSVGHRTQFHPVLIRPRDRTGRHATAAIWSRDT